MRVNAAVFYDLSLPDSLAKWATFVGVLVLGVLASTLLGLAVGGRVRNAKAATAVLQAKLEKATSDLALAAKPPAKANPPAAE